MRFSEQMVAFGDPREVNPFDITCPSAGKGRWADQRNWIYDFEQDLPAGIACSFSVKKGLASLKGNAIKANAYSFNTGGPAVMQSEPYSGDYSTIDENQIFVLGLDAPATADSMQKNVHCEAEGISEQIPVKLITGKLRNSILDWREAFLTRYYQVTFRRGDNEGHNIVFGIDERGSDREKFLKLRDGANSPIVVLQCAAHLPQSGPCQTGLGQRRHLGFRHSHQPGSNAGIPHASRFRSQVHLRTRQCRCGLHPGVSDEPQFFRAHHGRKRAAHHADGARHEADKPAITENDKKAGFVQSTAFPTPLPEKTKFKIVLPEVFTDDAGRSLSNASSFPLEVRTDENPPLAKFAADFGILELNASPSTPPLLARDLAQCRSPACAANLA